MNITIIHFSPSQNTQRVAEMIKNELVERKQKVQLIDISGKSEFFTKRNIRKFLQENIQQHDILLIGGPVYAHHLQYHVQDLITSLPKPDEIWGKIAIPFVTYGGITSGIALQEAGKLLNKSGRIVHAGMKITAPHRMTRSFLETEFNRDKLNGSSLPEISELADRIMLSENAATVKNHHKSFSYNGMMTAIKANLIFKEKMWHEKRYPQIRIDKDICSNCGICASNCPVLHLQMQNGMLVENEASPCIHCFNCALGCPKNAIEIVGDLDRVRSFMKKLIVEKGNKEMPESAVYPLVV